MCVCVFQRKPPIRGTLGSAMQRSSTWLPCGSPIVGAVAPLAPCRDYVMCFLPPSEHGDGGPSEAAFWDSYSFSSLDDCASGAQGLGSACPSGWFARAPELGGRLHREGQAACAH